MLIKYCIFNFTLTFPFLNIKMLYLFTESLNKDYLVRKQCVQRVTKTFFKYKIEIFTKIFIVKFICNIRLFLHFIN